MNCQGRSGTHQQCYSNGFGRVSIMKPLTKGPSLSGAHCLGLSLGKQGCCGGDPRVSANVQKRHFEKSKKHLN